MMKLFSKILMILGISSLGIKFIYYNSYSNALFLISILGLCLYLNARKKETGKYYGDSFVYVLMICISLYLVIKSIQDYVEIKRNGIITTAYVEKTYVGGGKGGYKYAIMSFRNEKGLLVRPSVEYTMTYQPKVKSNVWIKYSPIDNGVLISSDSKETLNDITFGKYIWYYVDFYTRTASLIGFIGIILLLFFIIWKHRK